MPSLTPITPPAIETGEAEFSLSEVVHVADGHWGFTLHGEDGVLIAEFIYCDEGHARRGAVGISASVKGAVFVGRNGI